MSWQSRTIGPALKLWGQRRAQAILSTIGITVGVAGLILVIAIGEGANRELQSALGALGSGTVIVRSSADDSWNNILSLPRVNAIERLSGTALKSVVPIRNDQQDISANQSRIAAAKVVGTSRSYQMFYRKQLHSGRFIADYDVRNGARICVLGWEAGKSLFPRGQVIGEQVRIGNDWYKVVGWLNPSTHTMPELESLDLNELGQIVYVPYSTTLFQPRGASVDEVILRFGNESSMMAALEVIKRVFAVVQAEPPIEYLIPIELLRHKQRVQQLFQILLLGIAAVMLLVGGVGMMNIMLFNVISRRAEIGLRRAIGATRTDIIVQFVTESMVIALAGGLAGILLGLLCAVAIDITTSWHTAFSLTAAIVGFVASVLIGGLFGSYPALQAASVSPVQSLRNQ